MHFGKPGTHWEALVWNLASSSQRQAPSSLRVQVYITVGLFEHPLRLASAHRGAGNTGGSKLAEGLGVWEV